MWTLHSSPPRHSARPPAHWGWAVRHLEKRVTQPLPPCQVGYLSVGGPQSLQNTPHKATTHWVLSRPQAVEQPHYALHDGLGALGMPI